MKLERILADPELKKDYQKIIKSNKLFKDKFKEAIQRIRGIHQVRRYLGHVNLLSDKWRSYLDNSPISEGIAFWHYHNFCQDLPFYTGSFSKVEEEFSDIISDMIIEANTKGSWLSELAYVFERPYNKNWGTILPFKEQRQQYFSLIHKLRNVHPQVITKAHSLFTSLINNQEREYPLEKIVTNICELDLVGHKPYYHISSSLAQQYIKGLEFLCGPVYCEEFGTDLNLIDMLDEESVDIHFDKLKLFTQKYQDACNERDRLYESESIFSDKKSPEYEEADSLVDNIKDIIGGFATQIPLVLQLNPNGLDEYVKTTFAMWDCANDIDDAGIAFKNHIRPVKNDYRLLATGIGSLLVFSSGKVHKFAPNISHEAELHQRLNNSKYIVGAIEDDGLSTQVLELEYVRGQTLWYHLVQDKRELSDQEVWKYSTEIFNGVCELTTADIYHRDLWLGNVMLDEEQDKAMIIDLGEATTEPNADKNIGSRRYRGENDIQTLGQLMYKMATGRNLFNTSPDQPTFAIADDILKNIQDFYSDKQIRARRLREVNRNISNPDLRETIKLCLTAPCRTDNANFATDEVYLRLEERFESYT